MPTHLRWYCENPQPGETYVEQLAGVENSLGRIAKIWGILQVSEKDESLRVKPEFLTVA
jgi:hypothetical protein